MATEIEHDGRGGVPDEALPERHEREYANPEDERLDEALVEAAEAAEAAGETTLAETLRREIVSHYHKSQIGLD